VSSLQKQLAGRNESLERALCELKQAEVQLVQSERLAAVGELAAGIAHEVNNPVNFALNAARAMETTVKDLKCLVDELAAEVEHRPIAPTKPGARSPAPTVGAESIADLSETLIELSGIIAEGLGRTSVLVGNLRDFAAPGRSGERSPAFSVEKGLRSTLKLLKHSLDLHKARVELVVADDLPTLVGDAGGLNQVFLNLVKNAAEAFGDEGGTIRIDVKRDHDWLVVDVADDGPGIAPEHRAVLFEPFFTTKPVGEGTGLGLSISRQIVLAHGGSLELESEVGHGSRLRVRLPIAGPTDATSRHAAVTTTRR
jgi:signal transduction histidine kinase